MEEELPTCKGLLRGVERVVGECWHVVYAFRSVEVGVYGDSLSKPRSPEYWFAVLWLQKGLCIRPKDSQHAWISRFWAAM